MTTITLPPLPPHLDEVECAQCGFISEKPEAHKYYCYADDCHLDCTGSMRQIPKFTLAQLSARDIEVARAALEAAAKVCEAKRPEMQSNGKMIRLHRCDGPDDCAAAVRALRIEGEGT